MILKNGMIQYLIHIGYKKKGLVLYMKKYSKILKAIKALMSPYLTIIHL